ncbi:hypothetical protein BUL40_13700 [Croceivirga radicis]|uniref:Pseudouridine synthase RsuA/RluA-like domain-containing protein n=1 Tax=Croceivirga radicis TaxID=1929488 RepID=A0A1V6LP19_9FLAO|nr:hypothetical protein BUL40_13700 [Croceivirga radicis]
MTKNSKLVILPALDQHPIPAQLDYPHFYRPCALAKEAAAHLQNQLQQKLPGIETEPKGRMLGVLVVKTQDGNLGYLSAYSGELQPVMEKVPFVPPVYQLPKGEDFPEMLAINAIGKQIKALENSIAFKAAKLAVEQAKTSVAQNIKAAKAAAKVAKAKRDQQRKKAEELSEEARKTILANLAKEGAGAGMDLRRYVRSENLRLEKAEAALEVLRQQIETLKTARKNKSAALQDAIFKSYLFLNAEGNSKDVKTVFHEAGVEIPPAGAGECAAPKLFQYAFKHKLTPVALAEFWWGAAPDSEIREHGTYYPACKGKCKPILAHMLKGLPVKPNPLLENFGANKKLEILFEDQHLVVVNKPSGMLSVPGKTIQDSVKTRILSLYPNATGPITVHRLDQDTSGILLVALTKEAHKLLQRQFLDRTIHKTYVAILDRAIAVTQGKIELPLILDIYNRPMQKVDALYGKHALTHYEVLKTTKSQTLIKLNPVTGRSHQLRVHCAHKLGLHAPIAGDNLYGTPLDRLYLHAQQIEFKHPIKQDKMVVTAPAPFTI